MWKHRLSLPLTSALLACTGGGGGTATAPSSESASSGGSEGPSSDPSGSGSATATSATSEPTTSTTGTTSATTTTTTSTTATTPGTTTRASDTATSAGTSTTDTTGTTTDTGGDPPPLGPDACKGYATRYWDCCKAHCGWKGNVNAATDPLQSCDKNDQSHGPNYDIVSACQTPAEKSAFTCYDERPWAVSDTLAYGFAAVPANGDICGRCYQLEFDGTGHSNQQDAGSVALKGKTMIVQATNIGFDVGGGQFDILTPGGGVGAFDACSYQWNVSKAELGATYGGFMSFCQQQGGDHAAIQQCVLGRCAAVFDEPNMADLLAGCEWYVDWYEAADNPNLRYQEVPCPAALVAISGIDRGPLNDVQACEGGGSCTQQDMDNCDCAWTNNGQNCGQDDGTCCWTACCA